MIKALFFALSPFSIAACSSSSSGSPSDSSAAGDTGTTCPNLAGTWHIAQHCDPTLVGESAVVTQTDCSLAFAAPFDGFSGTVTSDGKLTLGGPQTCSGTASSSAINLNCTPGTCTVKLTK